MADKRFSIIFDAKMETSNMKAALNEITKLTSNVSMNLPKNISSSLDKTIQSIHNELLKLDGLQGANPTVANASKITKTYENITAKFQTLKAIMGDVSKSFAIDPSKLFPAEVENKIKNWLLGFS